MFNTPDSHAPTLHSVRDQFGTHGLDRLIMGFWAVAMGLQPAWTAEMTQGFGFTFKPWWAEHSGWWR